MKKTINSYFFILRGEKEFKEKLEGEDIATGSNDLFIIHCNSEIGKILQNKINKNKIQDEKRELKELIHNRKKELTQLNKDLKKLKTKNE